MNAVLDEGDLQVVVERLDSAAVARVSGELDIASAPELTETLRSFAGTCDRVILDVSGLTFIDSTGLNLALDEHRRALADGHQFVVAGAAGGVLRALRLVGLDTVLPLAPDVDSVIGAQERGS
jgi:anti-anti-sigma factor